jgi:hypothetical protein
MNGAIVVTWLIVYLINLFFVRYLWNTVLVKHVTILKPTTTLWDTFLLSLALTIVMAPGRNAKEFSGGFVNGFAKGLRNSK